MMLWEAGHFDLDDELAKYIPAFSDVPVLKPGAGSLEEREPAREPIRIRHLLSHSSGLSYGFVDPTDVLDQGYTLAGLNPLLATDFDLEELCDKLATMPLAYQPGTSWRYSLATDVTARLIELWSGQPFDKFLSEAIFQPLGMVDTGFYVPPEKTERLVTLYAPTDFLDPMSPSTERTDGPGSNGYGAKPRFLSGGGGLVSTVSDYLTFMRILIGGGAVNGTRLLKADTVEQMRSNQLAPGVGVRFPMWSMPGTGFGLGLAVKESVTADESPLAQGEYHWGGLAGTHTWVAPRADLTGFCFAQRVFGFWHPFSHDFKALAYEIAGS